MYINVVHFHFISEINYLPTYLHHTTTYDGIGGESCVIVRRCTTSQPSGVIARCLGSFCDVHKPGCDSKHRRVSYDNLARSYEATRRCTTSNHNIN